MKKQNLLSIILCVVIATISMFNTATASAVWVKTNNIWNYTSNGQKVTGWENIDNTWYYFNESGAMQTGWKFVDGEWYHLKPSGAMSKGWLKDNNTWYYLKSNGAMARNWAKVNGEWYFFNSNGAMQTGLVDIKGETYYFNKDGAMQTGSITVNGTNYYFDEVNGNATILDKPSSDTQTSKPSADKPVSGGSSGGSYGGSSTSSSEITKPTFSVNLPKEKTATEGDRIELSVTVNSVNGTLSYQWYKDSAEIAGATSSTYVIEEATVLDSGVYRVVAFNKLGSNTKITNSETCVLKVTPGIVHSPALAYADTWYKGNTEKSAFTTINIVDSANSSVIDSATETWNAGINDSDNVICYVNGSTLTIAGNGSGKIYLINAARTFEEFNKVTAINGLDLLDTSNVADMHYMFLDCYSLKSLDLSSFDTSNVTNMMSMFSACNSLTTVDVTGFDTRNCENMRSMFHSCTSLTSLDLSSFTVTADTDAWRIAANCTNLTTVTLSDNFDTDSIDMFVVGSYKPITVYGANNTMKNYSWKDDYRIVSFDNEN